jgi:hypothetical protein
MRVSAGLNGRERSPRFDKLGVTGSSPVPPTFGKPRYARFSFAEALAKVDVDAEEDKRPDQDRNGCLADRLQGVYVVEVVVDRGDDHSDDQIQGTE